ncbi:hypothetical protein NQF87_08380 [Bombella sp. TMW 2.2559]|uniref:Uncharacterized protein n=1 Tax=Bombella dulcis TaxID=2967339 RepID=A0ABT3WGQ4_9PROT|nr:hypothetical protein [Bombella dulcis]MCX5616982.1 hypothetical protein [Bombella dulcis]
MTPCSSRSLYPAQTATIQNWPAKNVGDALDYSLYLAPFCCDRGESVIRLTVDVQDGTGLTVLWSALGPDMATIGLQGGNVGQQAITITLETSTGRRYVRIVQITVLPDSGSIDGVRASLAPPDGAETQPAALMLDDGRLLTL